MCVYVTQSRVWRARPRERLSGDPALKRTRPGSVSANGATQPVAEAQVTPEGQCALVLTACLGNRRAAGTPRLGGETTFLLTFPLET